MHFKVVGGTSRHGESSLCATCRYATIIKGVALKDEIVECGHLTSPQSRVPFAVVSCTGYSDRRSPSLRDMEDIAWVLRTDARKNAIGFVRARDLGAEDRHALRDPFED
jgi:hypothetical protein